MSRLSAIPKRGLQHPILIIACGALARELTAIVELNRWDRLKIACLPAYLHNRPERIPDAVRAKIRAARGKHDLILCAYGDCGTGGALDRVLAEEQVERIDGAHCYAFFAGPTTFGALQEEEIGSFYLTDFLARHFQRLVIKGLGLDRHPELLPVYFGNYRRVVHLSQVDDSAVARAALAAASRLGLPLTTHRTGLGGLSQFLSPHLDQTLHAPAHPALLA